ncbi:hypothetical protein [Xanthobacter agilis]|uniref:Uncharacterized protein n=1 Tax=Xanthobacter agilis TaxID=47492 RepID=A0ABU0LJT0_XANAG|nr:hypothetical protein [Xanthobacter agilis]MDQ0507344.1 hypothetical protein [Xanthobacter agilis]
MFVPPRPADWLADALDTHLSLAPRVLGFRPDPRGREKLESSAALHGSVIRLVRVVDRILVVVAIPEEAEVRSGFRRDLAGDWGTRNLLVVREQWLMRQPRLDTLEALAGFIGYVVSPTDRLHVQQHLLDEGGSACLSDCAAVVHRDEDQVGAVLALVARGALRIDYARPLSVHSIISLPTRRHGGKLVIGG